VNVPGPAGTMSPSIEVEIDRIETDTLEIDTLEIDTHGIDTLEIDIISSIQTKMGSIKVD
jgi:hypothetical protein